jgi:hypothetical protein
MSVAPAIKSADTASRPESPFVGLVPFEEGDAAFFRGRSTETGIVAANLRAARLTIVYGPSGVGKSSLLLAGVVPLLREEAGAEDEEDRFAVCVYRSWREDPLPGVEEAARAAVEEAAAGGALPPPGATLADTLRGWTGSGGKLLVVFDQFEEYFQYHPDEQRASGFGDELAQVVNDPTLPVNVLLSIREDALAKLDRFKGRIPSLFANYLRVDHLDLDAAREAIEGPIAAWNETQPAGAEPYSIEPALTEAVLKAVSAGGLTLAAGSEVPAAAAAVSGERVEAPFLQLVLERLWRATVADGAHTLTEARLEALGGAPQIVRNHLLEALGRLIPSEQDTASACFGYLVSSSKTKIAHTPADLAGWTQRPEPQVTAVLDKLSSAAGGRILRRVAPARDEESPSYELFHDILAEPILAWHRGHEADRRRRIAHRRFVRVGGISLALVAGFAALSIWALVQRSNAQRSARQVADYNLTLKAQINQLEHGSPHAVATVARLGDENRSLRAETNRLQTTSNALEARTRGLRAVNRQLRLSINGLNAKNTVLAAMINRLSNANINLEDIVLPTLQQQQIPLQAGLGFLKIENQARNADLNALDARWRTLLQKAAELGLPPPRIKTPSTSGAKFTDGFIPAKATRFGVPGISAGSTALHHQVADLQRQLAKLIAEQARRTDAAAFFRRADALLVRERSALRDEITQLERRLAVLEAQNSELETTRAKARHEEHQLSQRAAVVEAQNRSDWKQIESQRRTNANLQAKDNGQIAALGVEQLNISAESGENRELVGRIAKPVDRLLHAARDQSLNPDLAGLLAVVAYRVTPFDPDDPAHPQVYNALWLALDRLDAKAARDLIAPSPSPSGKVGTTQSALIVKALCAKIDRGLTRSEWGRFLPPTAPYTQHLSQPCP